MSIAKKKVRCTCVKCGKVKYFSASSIDRSEKFLCEPCDNKFISWKNKRRQIYYNADFTVETDLACFLKSKS